MAQTFTWTPTFGSALTTKPNVNVTNFGDGYEARQAIGLNSKLRSWKLVFQHQRVDVADAIEGFLNDRGAVDFFDWTPAYGSAGRWVCREWGSEPTGPYTRTVTATFEEVPA